MNPVGADTPIGYSNGLEVLLKLSFHVLWAQSLSTLHYSKHKVDHESPTGPIVHFDQHKEIQKSEVWRFCADNNDC